MNLISTKDQSLLKILRIEASKGDQDAVRILAEIACVAIEASDVEA